MYHQYAITKADYDALKGFAVNDNHLSVDRAA